MNHKLLYLSFLVFCLLITACSPKNTPTAEPTVLPSATMDPTQTATPEPTIMPTETPLPPTPEPVFSVSSPLKGYSWEQVQAAVVGVFLPPELGSDMPHQGVDIAYMDKNKLALEGLEIQAVFSGTVAASIQNRYPYGNTVIIETPLENIPAELLGGYAFPTPAPTLSNLTAMHCPAFDNPTLKPSDKQSLYVMYAHMLNNPTVKIGEPIDSGTIIGAIGNTGNSINPHIHLEMRIGPSGARFNSMGHYENTVTDEEMSNYCVWRISWLFQLIDPMKVLGTFPFGS